jgi:hypothetical protein
VVWDWRRAAVIYWLVRVHARPGVAVTYDAQYVIPLLPTEHIAIAANCRSWRFGARPEVQSEVKVVVPLRVVHDGPYLGGGGGGLGVPVVS